MIEGRLPSVHFNERLCRNGSMPTRHCRRRREETQNSKKEQHEAERTGGMRSTASPSPRHTDFIPVSYRFARRTPCRPRMRSVKFQLRCSLVPFGAFWCAPVPACNPFDHVNYRQCVKRLKNSKVLVKFSTRAAPLARRVRIRSRLVVFGCFWLLSQPGVSRSVSGVFTCLATKYRVASLCYVRG